MSKMITEEKFFDDIVEALDDVAQTGTGLRDYEIADRIRKNIKEPKDKYGKVTPSGKIMVNESDIENIAKAIRLKNGNGDTYEDYVSGSTPLEKISKTSNATNSTTHSGSYSTNLKTYETIKIPHADSITVQLAYQTESTNYDYVQICPGEQDEFDTTTTKYGGTTRTDKTITFPNTDRVTFYFKSDGSNGNYLGYYAVVTGKTASGQTIKSDVVIKENIFSISEMANAIKNL